MTAPEATDSANLPDPSGYRESALQSALEGDALQDQGRVEEAIAAYERALALDPYPRPILEPPNGGPVAAGPKSNCLSISGFR